MALCRFRIDDDEYEEFKEYCKKHNIIPSLLLRSMVKEVVATNGHKGPQMATEESAVTKTTEVVATSDKIEFPKYTTIQVKDIPIFDPHTGLPLEDPKIG